jgi:hypothetical protein
MSRIIFLIPELSGFEIEDVSRLVFSFSPALNRAVTVYTKSSTQQCPIECWTAMTAGAASLEEDISHQKKRLKKTV